MHKFKLTKLRLGEIGIGSLAAIILIIVGITINEPITVMAQQYSTPQGSALVITKICKPVIQSNPFEDLCKLSTNNDPSNDTSVSFINQNLSVCPSGGTKYQGQCPTSIARIPANSQLQNWWTAAIATIPPIILGQPTGSPTCPTGSTLQNGICTYPTGNCQAGFTLQNGVCTPPLGQCQAGYNLINGTCRPSQVSCPTNYTLQNGICIPPTGQCQNGYTLQNGVCTPPTGSCPAGYTLQGNQCVPPVSICSSAQINAGWTVVNGVCTAPPPVIPNPVCTTTQIANGYKDVNGVCTPPPPPPAEPITLVPTMRIVDNFGTVIPINANPIPLTNSFIGTTMNNPIDTGRFDVTLSVQAKPTETITGTGTLWITVNNQQIYPNGIPFNVNGLTKADGTINVLFTDPVKGNIATFSQSIAAISSNINQAQNIVSVSISNVKIQNPIGYSYKTLGTLPTIIANTQVNHDATNTILKNAQGQFIIVNPQDDTFTLQQKYSSGTYKSTVCPTPTTCTTQYNYIWTQPTQPAGIATLYLVNGASQTLLGSTILVQASGAPTGQCQVADNTSGLNRLCIDTSLQPTYSSSSSIIYGLPHSSQIRLVITGGQGNTDQTISTPSTQHNYVYLCTATGCTLS